MSFGPKHIGACCRDCGHTFFYRMVPLFCPSCGSGPLYITGHVFYPYKVTHGDRTLQQLYRERPSRRCR